MSLGSSIRTRIAPTPSGFLHIGNLYSFLITWLIAKAEDGTVLLRIDDLDAARVKREFVADIFETLAFIGMEPDEGPSGVDDFFQHHSQKIRLDYYYRFLEKLKEDGHLYACSCSRKQISSQQNEGIYTGVCKHFALDFDSDDVAWRIALPENCTISFFDQYVSKIIERNLSTEMGDFVVQRKDKLPAYQIASVADDLLMGVNVVVRGQDLLSSTACQLYLAMLLEKEDFNQVKWYHHSLVSNDRNEKISKSAGDTSVRWMIQQGINRSDLLNKLAAMIGLPQKPYKELNEIVYEYQLFK
jgi:glutamyl/glutaminyl-tRNA synthetase